MIPRVLLAVLALAAPAHAATGPIPVESSTRGGTLTDGDRYAVWMHGGLTRVLDEETRTVFDVQPPTDCGVTDPDSVGDGQLAYTCRQKREYRLFDLESRTWSTVPKGGYFDDTVFVSGIGRHWLVVTYDTGYHGNVHQIGIHRRTGKTNSDEPSDLARHMDPDSPELWAPLCRPLRRYRDPDWDEYTGYGSRFVTPYVVGDHALTYPRGKNHLVLRRCGRRARTTVTRSRHWQHEHLASGYVTWLEQDANAAVSGSPRGRGRIRLYSLASGRRLSWPVPGGINANTRVVHTRNRIIVDKPGSRDRVSRYEILLEPGDL